MGKKCYYSHFVAAIKSAMAETGMEAQLGLTIVAATSDNNVHKSSPTENQ